MITRAGFAVCTALAAVATLLFGVAPGQRPTLFIAHSPSCGPCRDFDEAFCSDAAFRSVLREHFDLRELKWDDFRARSHAQQLGVTRLPSFVVQLPTRRSLPPIVGFTNDDAGKATLLTALGLPLPRSNPVASGPAIEQPQSKPQETPDRPRSIDSETRARIEQIEKHQRRVGDEIGDLHSGLNSVNSAAREAVDSIAALREELRDRPTGTPPASLQELPDPVSPPAVPASAASEGIVGGLLKIGLGAAATYVGLPVGAGAIAAAGITWLVRRRRRGGAPSGETFPDEGTAPFPHRLDEARQHRLLRQQTERRVPEFDAAVGRIVDDEFQLYAQRGSEEERSILKSFMDGVKDRAHKLMPPSTKEYIDP